MKKNTFYFVIIAVVIATLSKPIIVTITGLNFDSLILKIILLVCAFLLVVISTFSFNFMLKLGRILFLK